MGGKKKVSGTQPRVKNNLKPSSSEKAAHFLVQQIGGLGLSSPLLFGQSIPVSSGLPIDSTSSTHAKLAGFVPIPQDPDAVGLHPGLLNVLRRLDKRDVRTKQKALQEFCQLIRTDVPDDEVLETGAVTAILPFWPRLYSVLSANSDRKVRELVQSAMYVLAKRVGRELAPYLKQLLPVWAFATVDFHEPAASLAEQGLSNVFPNGKRTEAYRVCARHLLDLFETKLNEDLLQVASISEKRVNVVRPASNSNTFELEQYSQSETAFIKLAGTIRFATVLAMELATLSSDSPHLQRFCALIAPDNLWSRVSREIMHRLSPTRSTECRSLIGSSSLVHASLYKLCSALCCNSSWATWLSETTEGNELARYLTASTLGRLGSLVTPVTDPCPMRSNPANSAYILIPPPIGLANVASSYSQCWDAALACLLNFSGDLVWSTVDWHSDLVPQLEILLAKDGIIHAKQVYPNLLTLLSKFPVDFAALTETDQRILEKLFVNATLSGLEHSITSKSGENTIAADGSQSSLVTYTDPGVSVVVVTGVLECSRFLVDRLSNAYSFTSVDDMANQIPLLHSLLTKVILRILADALDVLSDSRTTYLVCTQPPTYRQAYLDVVFMQVARFCANLGRSHLTSKCVLFEWIRRELFVWMSGGSVNSSLPDPTVTGDHFRFGLLDPLRLIHLVDRLAISGRFEIPKTISLTSSDQVIASLSEFDRLTVQHEWCVQLLSDISKQVQAKLEEKSLPLTLISCLYITYFCVNGYLPKDLGACPTPSLDDKLFTVILPNLPEDVQVSCWSRATVHGLVKAWCPVGTCAASPPPPDTTCSRFVRYLVPALLDVLPFVGNQFCEHFVTLCSSLSKHWLTRLLTEENPKNRQSVLSNFSGLLSQIFAASSRESVPLEQLRASLLDTITNCLNTYHRPDSHAVLISDVSSQLLQNLTSALLVLIEAISPVRFVSVSSANLISPWYHQLTQVLFALYSLEHFELAASVLKLESSPVSLVLASSKMQADSQPDKHLPSLVHRVEHLLFSYYATEMDSNQPIGDTILSLYELVFRTVCHLSYVPGGLIRFMKMVKSGSSRRALATRWLVQLSTSIKRIVEESVRDYLPSNDSLLPPSRSLLPGFGCLIRLPLLGKAFRLHQFGMCLDLPADLRPHQDDYVNYLHCLGLLRAWLCGFPEPWDLWLEFGWPIPSRTDGVTETNVDTFTSEPVRSVFVQEFESLRCDYGRLWHDATNHLTLAELLNLMTVRDPSVLLYDADPRVLCWINSVLNAVLLNRVRTVHPNSWPHPFTRIASCTDELDVSWIEQNLLSTSEPSDTIAFHRLVELCLPAGIVRRCLPRQELLGRLKSLSFESADHNPNSTDPTYEYEKTSRILELCSSLTSVRVVTPIYVSTFLSIPTEDCRKWLTEIGEASEGEAKSSLWTFQSGFHATLAAMSFFESLLLLWQPWQWHSNNRSDKSSVTHQLGLIQLSLRLQQLRPSLTRSQWDLMLCLIVSWVCNVVEHSSASDSELGQWSLLGFRAFRVAAALGGVFVDRSTAPVGLDLFLLSSLRPKPPQVDKSSAGDEWDDDLDAEADDVEPNDVDDIVAREDESEETEKSVSENGDASEANLLAGFDEIDEEHEVVLPDVDVEDADNENDVFNQNVVLPRRGRVPLTIRTDWDNFFAAHLYSSMLPLLFKSCLPSSGSVSVAETPVHLQAFCAAFATCSSRDLVRLLTDQPQLVLEYLVDFSIGHFGVVRISQLIRTRTGSVSELTPGLRASFDLACRLLSASPTQSGQLLGHILLNRLVCTYTHRPTSGKTLSLSNFLIHRLPTSWLSALYDPLPAELEQDLTSENGMAHWGKGSRVLSYLVDFSLQHGWTLNCLAHQSILRYLLAWDAILTLFTSAGPQARARLQRALLGSSAALFDRLMLCLGLLLPPPSNLEAFASTPCRLEPDERLRLPVSSIRTDLIAALSLFAAARQRRPMRLATPLTSGDDQEWRDAFGPDDPLLGLPGRRLIRDISHLSVRLFRRFLAEAPALIRRWCIRLNDPSSAPDPLPASPVTSPLASCKPGRLRQLAIAIDMLVSRHLSTGLARDEVILVQYRAHLRQLKQSDHISKGWFDFLTSSTEVGSMSIRTRPLSREVVATYQVTDEHSIEMLIQLPVNYPLGLATVTCGRGVAVSTQQWHTWNIQLSVFINNQNGSILDGIDLWQRNVRKKFEGVSECAICYSVVHNTNFSLPKMQCHTCRKLFHYACMYRWFTTSRNPACPLCRNMFFGPTGRPT
ncbi:ATP synthase F0 A subunit [Paragonimus westermani]|uniref:E3 ubiquitin-protein ligase listerin n=1 Tax=Paragonimus westermani TaxID=34504 RepID=A0A8T0DYY7_9TREM|nr:ATP synthase F0 A subunit [Paragonimus westermani]